MQKAKSKYVNIITPTFRVSFPHVFEKHTGFEGQDAKYSITMLFPKNIDMKNMIEAVNGAIVTKWGSDKAKWPKGLRKPFRDGDVPNQSGVVPDGYAGHYYVRATSNNRPGIVDANKQEIMDPEEFYAGCYARAQLSVFAYSKAGNNGVSFGLSNLQKMKDGQPFSGRQKAEDAFEVVEADDSDKPENYSDEDDFLN